MEWKAKCVEEFVFETTVGRKMLHLNFRSLGIKVFKYSHIFIQTVKFEWPGPEIFVPSINSGAMSIFSYFRSGSNKGGFCPPPLQVSSFFNFYLEKPGNIVTIYTCCI